MVRPRGGVAGQALSCSDPGGGAGGTEWLDHHALPSTDHLACLSPQESVRPCGSSEVSFSDTTSLSSHSENTCRMFVNVQNTWRSAAGTRAGTEPPPSKHQQHRGSASPERLVRGYPA